MANLRCSASTLRWQAAQLTTASCTIRARRLSGLWFSIVAALALSAGCASHADRIREARERFCAGDAVTAAELLEQQRERSRFDYEVISLDLAVAQLFSGNPALAEQTLREARDRLDYLEQQNLAESAASMFTDDNRRAYAGEDYEKVLLRVLLALANLMDDGLDAEAYSLQVTAKQQAIIEAGAAADGENPKLAYNRVAAGAYLRGVLREETHGNYDDVERSFTNVVSWAPDFEAARHDLERARHGVHSAQGNGVLHVFAFVGRGPYKRAVSEVPTSPRAILIADRILSVTGEHTLPPTVAPIQVPQVVVSENTIDRLDVRLAGRHAAATETITDVGALAVQQHQAVYAHVIARAVARRAIKKAAIYSAKTQLEGSNPWVDLAFNVAGVAWEATEAADTRNWSFLPDTIQVCRLELPAGDHSISLLPARGDHVLGPGTSLTARVEDGRNTYLLACFPGATPTGRVLVSARR